ncbi:MAG: hypothetical protein JXP34_23880 [Planctomycetes bacterium]|nr:hypothetical protein [Planctomycetota bacterium]
MGWLAARRPAGDPWDAFPLRRLLSSYGWCAEPAGTWWARARGGIVREAVFLPEEREGPLGRRFRHVRRGWVAQPFCGRASPWPGRRPPGRRALGTLPCASALLRFDEGREAPKAAADGLLEGRYALGPRGTDLRVLIRARDLGPPPPSPWGPWRGFPGRVPASLAGGAAAVAFFRTGPRAWIAWREGRLLHLALAQGGAIRFAGWILFPEGDGPAACAGTLRRYLAAWPTRGAERVRTLGFDPFIARLFGSEAAPLVRAPALPAPLASRPAALVAAGCALLAAGPWAEAAVRPAEAGPTEAGISSPGPARTRKRRASRRRRSSGRVRAAGGHRRRGSCRGR